VDVGSEEANGSDDLLFKGTAEGEVPAEAHAYRTDAPVAVGAREEVCYHGLGVRIEAFNGFGKLVGVATVGALLVVSERGARSFMLVVTLTCRVV
jgi:hypothetical protein